MNLSIFNTASLFDAATDLFSQLKIKLNSNTAEPLPVREALKSFYKDNDTFNSIEQTFYIGTLDNTVLSATGMFDESYSYKQALQQADKNYEGLMLFALQLSKQPTRTEISELTRAFNRISQKMPVALLLSYRSIPASDTDSKDAVRHISIAISERFKYKQNWRKGEKAGKVIILRDIHTQTTHTGHLRILQDLMKPVAVTNYAQLHEHWLQVLDVNLLNKKFFRELANWYFWAMDNVAFPDDIEKKKEARNATSLIRLITRIIFIWFIKEKKLVPANLFRKDALEKILKSFNPKNHSSDKGEYYQAILQNLFFGTLNQIIDKREFAETHKGFVKGDQGVRNIYRFPEKFLIPEDEVKKLFKDVPFLNGGLFDCLDKTDEETKKEIFVDGFTRDEKHQATVPDYLFFGEEQEVDLNEIYATKNKKYKVKGLVNLLESYKFTVAENTPMEEEIALDPELLGKVFENLLASYNPETQTTARKQTGSFYTPREIVNYMVDESLLEYLKSTVSIPADDSNVSIPAEGLDRSRDASEYFDPNNEIQIHTGNLPHWQQENVWYFITFRLADSIPKEVVEAIKSEREAWLKKHSGLNRSKDASDTFSKEELKEYYRLFSERIENLLNSGKGSCVLKDEKIAKIVADALLHFDNQRYVLDEWVIMPNHVHVLVKLLGEYKLPDILHSWKSFTANEINKATGKKGQLWMHESYDHIVRNEKALHAIRNYIRQNPAKAGLSIGSFLASGESRSKDASDTFEARLRDLFSYSENANPFNGKETKILIKAINNCKILDPACGSGAFPMGVLHKMVHLLTKLDPDNSKWKEEQEEKIIGSKIKELEQDKKAIQGLSDKAVKEKAVNAVDERLKEIKGIFESENNFDDYARKLFLIENCIYGIDIQPIAVQIAKLRFFISLIIDQNKQEGKDNFGIRSLPNLETKFVAANTLIGLDKPAQGMFRNPEIEEKEKQLKELRHNYFTAKTRRKKIQFQTRDKKLRKEIAKLLEHDGWNTTVAKQIVAFDPYDQNLSAPFFESEWMFGLTDGFDIVIGNPPYINISNLKPDEYRLELRNKFRSAKNKSDTYAFFLEQGFNLLKTQGTLSYIIPQTWKATDSFSKLREIIFKEKSISKIVDLEFGTFDAIVKPMVVVISNAFGKYNSIEVFNDSFEKISEIKIAEILKDSTLSINTTLNKEQKRVFQVIEKDSIPLENIIQFSRGIKTSDDGRFIHTSAKNKDYKKVFRGKNIKGFEMNWNGEYVWYRPDLMKEKVGSVSYTKEFFEVHEKLITQRVNSSMQLLCAYDDNGNYFLDTTNVSRYETWDKKTSLKYLCAILNSKVINYWYCNKYLMPTIGIYEMHTIPIKKAKDQKPFITLVDKILSAKEKNPKADTSKLEKQLDEMVYKLYELTEEEIKIVENKK